MVDFAADLKARGGDPAEVRHVCMDMSAAYAKGTTLALAQAQISYDRFHVIAMANEAMDQVRRAEMREDAQAVRSALGGNDRKTLKQLVWGMRRNPTGWSQPQLNAMHWLQRSNLKSARAWRSWARRCRLEPFKKLAITPKERLDAVARGMLDHRSNAFVEAMNGFLERAKRAAMGFRTATNFIAIVYLRMSKLTHLPDPPFSPANAK